jgi:hypothetical protein
MEFVEIAIGELRDTTLEDFTGVISGGVLNLKSIFSFIGTKTAVSVADIGTGKICAEEQTVKNRNKIATRILFISTLSPF